MATDDAVTPIRVSPVGTTDAAASGCSAPSSSIAPEGAPQLGGGAPAEDGSCREEEEARPGQACSICVYRKSFSHDKHNAGTCGARSRECLSSPTVPVEFRAEHCPCSIIANLQKMAVAERREAEPTTRRRNEVGLAVRQATIELLAESCR